MSGPLSPHSDDLREYYFSAPTAVVAIDALEFRHPAFVDDDGHPAAARFANDPQLELVAILEDGAPMNAGETVTFSRGQFDLSLPESSSPGLPTCQISVANIGRDLMEPIEQAVSVPQPISVTYRQFLSDDLTQPGVVIDGMTIRDINASGLRITATAGFEDDLNTPYPRAKYTPQEYPNLVR